MGRYIFKRVLWFIPIMIGVSFIVFTLMYFTPSDAAEVILGANATPERLEEFRHTMGLDRPFIEQYLSFLGGAFKGDFGNSYMTGLPVMDSIITALPYSLRVGLIGITLASVFGITLGVIAAVHQDTWIDNLSMLLALFFISMPGFWFALMLVSFFSVKLGWLPVMGVVKWQGYILPCMSIALGAMARIARQTRSSLLEVIRQDYITTARAKGQTDFIITYHHALKNALLPIITTIGGMVGGILGAGLVVETIFSIPGMGVLLIKGISNRDYPVVEGCVVVVSLFAGICILITDLLYALVDPRIRSQFKSAKKSKGGERKMNIDGKPKRKKQSQANIIFRQLRKNRLAVAGVAILTIVVLLSLFAPFLTSYGYSEQSLTETFQAPSKAHLLGTDNLGRDLLSRLLYGGRLSLLIGASATVISTVLGLVVGITAGYCGGKIDSVLMRFIDIYSSIPSLVLAIALAAVLGNGVENSILAIGVSNIGGVARLVRIQFLSARGNEYVEAARATNCSDLKIIFKYIFPNTVAPLIVNITMSIGTFIMQAATLSFIGLGSQPPTPEWGAILSEGRVYMRSNMNLVLFPGICILLTTLSCNLFGDGLRDALDPRLRD